MLRPGHTFMNKWILGEKLGEGGCAEVFSVRDKAGTITTDLVIKCAVIPTGKGKAYKERLRIVNTLYYENMLHKGVLLGFKYAPMIPKHSYGDENGLRFLVMQRLDFDLKTLAEKSSAISGEVLSFLGMQILEGLEIIHKKGYVYVDVKPDNFMILKAQSSARGSLSVTSQDRLFFIDFGLMEKFTEYMSGGAQRAAADRGGIAGTPNYASLDVHAGISPSRKDDIESLGYVLLAIASRGVLPWFTATSDVEGLKMKKDVNIMHLAASCGFPVIGEWIQQARNIGYENTPNYDAFRALLQQLASSRAASVTTIKKIPKVAEPLADVKSISSKKRKPSSAAVHDVENVNNFVEEAVDKLPKKASRAKATKATPVITESETTCSTAELHADPIPKKRKPASASENKSNSVEDKKSKKSIRSEAVAAVQALNDAKSSSMRADTSAKVATTSINTPKKKLGPVVPTSSIIDIESDEEGSPTPKKESKKKATPAPGPFTTNDNAPRSSERLRTKSSCESSDTKKGVVTTVVLQSTQSNLSVMAPLDRSIIIGRDDSAALSIDDGYVSDRHFEAQAIVGTNDVLQLKIRDLKSSNGTKVNNRRLTPNKWHTASIGDVISLGMTKLDVKCRAAKE